MNIEKLYIDHKIDFATEGSKHVRSGWVQIHCPFCSGPKDYHLGYNIYGNYFNCWRCGRKQTSQVISVILNITHIEAKKTIKIYGGSLAVVPQKKIKLKKKRFILPTELEPLSKYHQKWIVNVRNFDPEYIKKVFKVKSTTPLSRLQLAEKSIPIPYRIFIPYLHDGEIVSFDTRDVSGNAQNKYMACPEDREIVGRKNMLYGISEKWNSAVICVEGPTDVWRLGVNSVALSGTGFKKAQVRELAKNFNRVAVYFDPEYEAQKKAKKLISELKFRGVDAFNIEMPTDPGDLDQAEADYLVKQIVK